jgi:hypothetical protein
VLTFVVSSPAFFRVFAQAARRVSSRFTLFPLRSHPIRTHALTMSNLPAASADPSSMQESQPQVGSQPNPAEVRTPQQAAALDRHTFQATAYAVLTHQSQQINELAETVSAVLKAQRAAAAAATPVAAAGNAPASGSGSGNASVAPEVSSALHLDHALPFANPRDASFMDRLLSHGSHGNYHGAHGQALERWFDEYDLVFQRDRRFTSEEHKLLYALLHLKGDALAWHQDRERTRQGQLQNPQAGVTPLQEYKSWEELKQGMREWFCPRSSSEEARRELHSLRQTRNLDGYIERFRYFARLIHVPAGQSIDEELIAAFKLGLKDPQVRLNIATRVPQPKTLFEVEQLARQAEDAINTAKYSKYSDRDSSHRDHYSRGTAFPYYSSQRNYGGYNGHVSNTAAPVPMELGAITELPEWQVRSPQDSESSSAEPAAHPPAESSDGEEDDSPSRYAGNVSPSDERSQPSAGRAEANAFFHTGRGRPPPRGGDRRDHQSRPAGSSRERFLQQNVCWNCGQQGHFLRDCPKQRNRDNSSGPTPSAPAQGPNAGRGSYSASYQHAKKM